MRPIVKLVRESEAKCAFCGKEKPEDKTVLVAKKGTGELMCICYWCMADYTKTLLETKK